MANNHDRAYDVRKHKHTHTHKRTHTDGYENKLQHPSIRMAQHSSALNTLTYL